MKLHLKDLFWCSNKYLESRFFWCSNDVLAVTANLDFYFFTSSALAGSRETWCMRSLEKFSIVLLCGHVTLWYSLSYQSVKVS